MKRLLHISALPAQAALKTVASMFAALMFTSLMFTSCDNSYLESDNIEELVVEGWIENGHAPVVMVSSTLPVSSTPQPLSDINEHILRYAEVYIEHNGEREYLTARLTDRFTIGNYFTSPSLRGVPGESYHLHVKWLDFEASAVCTIPEPVAIDTVYMEKTVDDTSYVAKMIFHNDPEAGRFYQTFRRSGNVSKAYEAVNFSTLDGATADSVVVETFTKPVNFSTLTNSATDSRDIHFHPGDTVALKLATIERPMFDFWKDFSNKASSSGGVLSAPKNIKGNVTGAIGYWAGYGIDIKEIEVSDSDDGPPET